MSSNTTSHSDINVDPKEIAKFDELAASWWDPSGDFKPLHAINPLRANWIDSLAPVAGQKLVDVGCGGGILAESMALRGALVTGIDMSEGPLEVARIHRLESGVDVDYKQCTAEQLAEENPGEFDIVCCLEMLEHVPDPASVIQALATLVKPGGKVFLSTINRNLKAYALAILGAEYILNMLAKGTHDYSKFIKPSELARMLREAGLELDEMTGMRYNPLTDHFSLHKNDVDVNYMLCASKPL